MTEASINFLEDLGAEFARIDAQPTRAPRRHRLRLPVMRLRALAVAAAALAVLGVGTYAVPPTRAAIDDLAGAFSGWIGGDDGAAPGRALRPEDDAPNWVREAAGRLIVAKYGVELYVARSESVNGSYLNFALDDGIGVGNTIEGWRREFEDHAVKVLGPTGPGAEGLLDDQGRYRLMGVSARSVARVELRYEDGPPAVETGLDGGFILLGDASRRPTDLVAYDSAGRELERIDAGYLDMRYACDKNPGFCPSR